MLDFIREISGMDATFLSVSAGAASVTPLVVYLLIKIVKISKEIKKSKDLTIRFYEKYHHVIVKQSRSAYTDFNRLLAGYDVILEDLADIVSKFGMIKFSKKLRDIIK